MVGVINSPDNEKVRYLRSLHEHDARQRARHFLIEGVRLVEEALASPLVPDLILADEEALARTVRGLALRERLRHLPGYFPASPRALKAAAETVTPQGVVAAAPIPEPPAAVAATATALVLDGIQDPGNLGTILRTAEAAGTGPLLLAPGTTDPFAPKVVRAAMGAHFRLAFVVGNWDTLARYLQGRDVWLAEAGGGIPYYDVDWSRPSAVIIGSEAHGPSSQAERLATGRVTIPMAGPTESLNAAIAAAVILFEALRQRRTRKTAGA